MELSKSSYHKLRNQEVQAGLPDGQLVDPSAVLAKQNAQDGSDASANKRSESEEIATKLDIHHNPDFKEFLNLVHKSLKEHSEKSENNISIGTLSTLLKSTESFAEKHNFTEIHKNLDAHFSEINKTKELNESLDLEHTFKDKDIKTLVLEFFEVLFSHEPHLKATEEGAATEEKPKEKEYKNKAFGSAYKIIKPLVDTITGNQVKISVAGAISHAADAVAKISEQSSAIPSVPKSLESPIGGHFHVVVKND